MPFKIKQNIKNLKNKIYLLAFQSLKLLFQSVWINSVDFKTYKQKTNQQKGNLRFRKGFYFSMATRFCSINIQVSWSFWENYLASLQLLGYFDLASQTTCWGQSESQIQKIFFLIYRWGQFFINLFWKNNMTCWTSKTCLTCTFKLYVILFGDL